MIMQKHCGTLLGTKKTLLPTACSSLKSFSKVNHYPFFQNCSVANLLSKTALTLTSILFLHHNQALKPFPFYHFYNHLPSKNFWNFLLSDLLNFTSKSACPSPAQSYFILIWTHLNLTVPVSGEHVWKVCLIAALFVIWLRGKKKIHIALECLWNGSEWKGLTERNPTERATHEASWLEKLPTGFLFPSYEMRNSDQLWGRRVFALFCFLFFPPKHKLINILN